MIVTGLWHIVSLKWPSLSLRWPKVTLWWLIVTLRGPKVTLMCLSLGLGFSFKAFWGLGRPLGYPSGLSLGLGLSFSWPFSVHPLSILAWPFALASQYESSTSALSQAETERLRKAKMARLQSITYICCGQQIWVPHYLTTTCFPSFGLLLNYASFKPPASGYGIAAN